MYFATPPPLRDPGDGPVPLFITAVVRRAFDGAGNPSPGLGRYISDLATPHNVATRTDVLLRPHPSYSMMSDALLREAMGPAGGGSGADTDTDPPDLIVLAYSIPEIDPRRCVTTRINQLSAGDPFGFAVSDQGTAAPFTGLGLVRDYLAAGACRRAMLVVAEQSEVPYDAPPDAVLAARDTAVGVLLGPAGPARVVALRQHPAVAPSDVDAVVAAELAALPPGPERVTVIGADDGPAGLVCTAPWWALADRLRVHPTNPGDRPHRTVIVDYEASLGYVSLLAVDVGIDAGIDAGVGAGI